MRLRIFQFDRFEHFAAGHFSNLGVAQELDVFACLNAPREIIRHAFRKTVAADNEQDFRRAFREEHSGLSG